MYGMYGRGDTGSELLDFLSRVGNLRFEEPDLIVHFG
jgi:hypothetical protein